MEGSKKGVLKTSQVSALSNICTAIKNGKLESVVREIELIGESNGAVSKWDIRVGVALWTRIVELKSLTKLNSEVRAVERCYKLLASEFHKNFRDIDNILERLRVLATCNKYLVGVHKLVLLETSEEILKGVTTNVIAVQNSGSASEFKSVCTSFYAVLWNLLRENFETFDVSLSLNLVKQSLSWLTLQGMDQFHVISHKLSQVHYLLNKTPSPSITEDFVLEFISSFEIVAKEVLTQTTSPVLIKGSKSKKLLIPEASNFYGIASISFILARFMVQIKEFEKALIYSERIVNIGKLCFDPVLLEVWKKGLTTYVKISAIILWKPSKSLFYKLWDTKSLFQCGQELRELRKHAFSSKFEKDTPGYNLALLYILMESIGWTISSFASRDCSLINWQNLPLDTFMSCLKELYSLEEACNILKLKKGILTGVTEIKIWDTQVTFVFHMMRIACDRISEKDAEIDDDVCTIADVCYTSLSSLSNQFSAVEDKKISELYARLSQYSTTIASAFQKRKSYENALAWCNRAVDSHNLWKSSGSRVDFKANTLLIALLKADCLRQLNKAEESLKWLSMWLLIEPSRINTPSVSYDIFEQIPWTDWNTHWIQSYKEVCNIQKGFNLTVVDYIEEEDPMSLTDEFISKALRFQLNSYFAGRHVIPNGLVATGEALIERSSHPIDNALGYLARAIGFWWGSPAQVDFSVEIIQEGVDFLSEEEVFKEADNLDTTAFLGALITMWQGICILRKLQYFVEAEMDILKKDLMSENPEKYKDRDTGEERSVSGLSMVNYGHERQWATCLIRGTEILFRFAASEEGLKSFSDRFGPALVLITCRLTALLLSALGDPINAVKTWHVVFKLAKVYDRKGLMVLSASEILKVIPDLNMDIVKIADQENQTAMDKKLIKHNRAICFRLPLAKSIACFNNKMYSEGIEHLLEVFDFFLEKDNFDSSHHLLGEATYVLSLYRSIQFSHHLDLSRLPSTLSRMSPVGLAIKGFKLLGGLTREMNIEASGWTDLVHNNFLVGSIMHIGVYAMKMLRDSGKTRELKCFTSDAVNMAQHCGFVSRSIAMIVPMIELDIEARNFLQAQMKIDGINEIFKNSRCPEDEEVVDPETYQKMVNNLKLPLLTIERLVTVQDIKWSLKTPEAKSMYYRNRGEKAVSAVKKDLREGYEKEEFTVPSWISHHLSCCCYVCVNPNILPVVFTFLHAQARFLACMGKYKHAMAVLETTKLYHDRAIFRHVYNLSIFTIPLSVISCKLWASKAVESVYVPFCVQAGLHALQTQMLIEPVKELKMTLNAMKKAVQLIDTIDPKDYVGKSFPLELGCAAIYHYLFASGIIKIPGSEIRELLEEKLKSSEKENNSVPSPPSPTPNAGVVAMPPPAVPRKGILKGKSKKIQIDAQPSPMILPLPKRHEAAEPYDRSIPVINFEIDVDELSSSEAESSAEATTSSSSSLTSVQSVSRGKVDKPVETLTLSPPPARQQRSLRSNVTDRRRRI